MLRNFTVSNFGSITEPVRLSLELDERVARDENETFLPVTMILGANCSGKSTLIEAMSVSQDLISARSDIDVETALYSCENLFKDKPSAFEWEIEIEGKSYIYGFEVTKEKIVKEYLYACKDGEYSMIFQRYKEKYAFTRQNEGSYSKIETNQNVLFLSSLADGKDSICTEVANHIQNNFKTVDEYDLSHFFKFDFQNPQLLEDIKEVDLPIQWDDGQKFYQQCWESEGTEKYLSLVVLVRKALKNGTTLIVDDLEDGIHPFLIQWILNKFMDLEENPNQAQLIFTTRTPWITQFVPLKQDQIIFTNQSRGDRPMEVYKLSDFDPLPGREFVKDYFNGRYDAIPRMISS